MPRDSFDACRMPADMNAHRDDYPEKATIYPIRCVIRNTDAYLGSS